MFAVVFLILTFIVLITFLVVLAAFFEAAFYPKLPIARQTGTSKAREPFADRQPAAVSGSTQPIVRATLVKRKHFEPKRSSDRLRPQPHL
jgi:hypothetical protein